MSSMHIITPDVCISLLQASECCFDIMGLFLFILIKNFILKSKLPPLKEGTPYIHDLSDFFTHHYLIIL